ncbi:uncharacterized protein LOC134836669, partial [Culicoides brevitarsis]|uniref:uncharacterized protein LOC134836669 n=1 Tax=Culicoides brevitarsis TaxID=469753 RepID=UPI00307B1E78
MIIRPMISYAASAWWTKTETESAKRKLSKLQRLALLMVTRAMRSTPTSALEKLTGTPPLHLWIQYEAMNANYRFMISEKPEIAELLDKQIEERLKSNHILSINLSDSMTPKYVFDKKFIVKFPKRIQWSENNVTFPQDATIWFTDGSKMENAGCGAYEQNNDVQIKSSLGGFATIFQAEVLAIELAAQYCLESKYSNKDINILSDSQAALEALNDSCITSKLVFECRIFVNDLASSNRVTLMWVPGHCGIEGNEKADSLAR